MAALLSDDIERQAKALVQYRDSTPAVRAGRHVFEATTHIGKNPNCVRAGPLSIFFLGSSNWLLNVFILFIFGIWTKPSYHLFCIYVFPN
jgi:hypothetical protein